jgi:REP element-mobilizing transposase RayT
MPDTYICNRVHIIFSTKERRSVIAAERQARTWEYMAGIARNVHAKVFAIGGTGDHAHLLLGIPATEKLAEIVQKSKANSSRWLRTEGVARFEWQAGYGAFSVSVSLMDTTIEYIRNQPEHHKRNSFEEEWKAILARHGIECAVPDGTQV